MGGSSSTTGAFRVFATNDDGIAGEGLVALARAFAVLCEMTIVAPEAPRSAVSHAITLHKPLRVDVRPNFPWPEGAVEGCAAYSCSGSPTDCTMLGILELMKERPPHLVISGINDGQNLAEDITYSGTVAGAMEGAILGIPAISISFDTQTGRNFATAAAALRRVIERIFFNSPPHPPWPEPDCAQVRGVFNGCRFLNMNVPDVPLEGLRGIRVCQTGFRSYKDIVQKMHDPRGRPYFWIAGERVHEDEREDTDVAAMRGGYATLTPLTWNLTDHAAINPIADLFA